MKLPATAAARSGGTAFSSRLMASIRRTQSPAHRDRSHQGPFTPPTPPPPPPPPHRLSPLSSSFSPSPPPPQRTSSSFFTASLRRLMTGVFFLQRHPPRRWGQQQQPLLAWKRSLPLRFLLCFLLGFFLGFSPFADIDGRGPQDFSLEIGSPLLYHRSSGREPSNATAATQQDLTGNGMMAVTRRANRVIETVMSGGSGVPTIGLEAKRERDDELDPPSRKLLIVVTPTYNRALQAFFLSRLGQTLRLVRPPLLWIVVEMDAASAETAELLRRTGVTYRHVVCKKNSTDIKDRGVDQRNAALEHIELHNLDGIVYFADDDNIYSLELFEHIREIRRFGTWPVAMLAQSKNKATLEGPVCNGIQIIGWHTNEKSKRLRRFHVDMSGFAFNSTILWDTKRWHYPTTKTIRQLDTIKEGFQETTFIEQIVEDESHMEGIPHGCFRIMNWHLHLEAPGLVYPRGWKFLKNLEVIIPIK